MKKLCFLLLMSWVVMDVTAQNVVYSNLKGLVACEGDTDCLAESGETYKESYSDDRWCRL